jgi:hypothetical protein
VSFIGTGKCTIDANQPGTAEYLPAPQVQQSFSVATVQVLSSKTSAPPTTPVTVASSTGTALKGGFRAVSAMLHQPSDIITLEESLDQPGTLTWVLTFPNGPFGAYAASANSAGKKCRPGLIRLAHRCLPRRVIFGEGQKTFASSGVVAITIKPTRAAKRAFKNAKRKHRDIKLTATITFQPSSGGAPVTHAQVLTIRLARAK